MTPNERLKAEVDAQGRKYIWLAEQMNVSASRISELLNGKRPLDGDEIARFCIILQIPASRIIPTPYDVTA